MKQMKQETIRASDLMSFQKQLRDSGLTLLRCVPVRDREGVECYSMLYI